jgi:hypothetical protein
MNRKQQLFDEVAVHLMTQMKTSVGEWGSCRYFGTNGRRCAVGCLIDPQYYNPYFEGVAVHSAIDHRRSPLLSALEKSLGFRLTGDEVLLLSSLQKVHDAYLVDRWHIQLAKIADDEGLSVAVLGPLAHYKEVRMRRTL